MPTAPSIRPAEPRDAPAISALNAHAMGPGRFARTAYRVREGATAAFSPFCRVALLDGRLVAAVRFTQVTIGGKGGALLLGPLAVHPAHANRGYGRGLVAEALEAARAAGVAVVVLVGDEPYYARLGFRRVPRGQIVLPGPVDADRVLAAELRPGALADYAGSLRAQEGAEAEFPGPPRLEPELRVSAAGALLPEARPSSGET
jgi:predicted N-acetyltransferase YhbS